ncbi:MAG: putative selenoprotein [Gammaproteobacteria bacterium]|nr:putative selenoprotein [Gammaproteobacteria bacterium]
MRGVAGGRAWLAQLNGDAAYAHYLEHWGEKAHAGIPLSRAQFYCSELERRWNGVRRCC